MYKENVGSLTFLVVSGKISHKNLDSKKSTYYGDMFYFILNNKK